MTVKSIDELGTLQREVLEILWKLGRATVHEVRDEMIEKRDLAYTTVLTAMQKLEKAGLLKHERDGKTYVYLPTQTREKVSTKSVRRFVKNVFNGDALMMFQHLMQEDNLTDNELVELRKLIDKARKERAS
jgi:predicted transcriptional regulator